MSEHAFQLMILINVLGVLGIVVWHLQGRSRPTQRLVAQIIFFIAMTISLIFANVMPFRFDAPHLEGSAALVVTAKILWWTHLSWATIGFVRIYIVLDGRPRQARLIQDLLVAVVYLGVVLSVMAFVFGVPIGTLLATSGIFAIILGLALQNTLGDLFSGIALTLGRPYTIGDWILLSDATEGRVIASNWRSTYLLTGAHNLVVLPNSVLAKQSITNVSKPDENHQIMLGVRVVPTRGPKFILNVMLDALNSCNGIVHDPAPSVSLVNIDAAAIDMELYFRVTSPAERSLARNEVIDLVYRHCLANGLVLAKPPGSQTTLQETSTPMPLPSVEALLETIPMFSELTAEERSRLAASATTHRLAAGEKILDEGEVSSRLLIISVGIILLHKNDEDVARLAPGDYLGEKGLFAGTPEIYEATTLTPAKLYELNKEAFEQLVAERPTLADDLVASLSNRGTQQESGAPPTIASGGSGIHLIQAIRSRFGARHI
ncbi:mechanosensitive ion channel domain-containing protein [Phyllobacterium bourgognense]|uniref:Small-conductance mechanosensitive channel n=1 Tax=Phyllobacterium bourgognense TaxID=314236 RepID=A0A368YRL7_9HYPH|nr:mechanosensitive ion channel family protein [Phyllobacterium bourgognense]RCW81916.1 small-conductance mechanosensitive channel [Phyllobacterium bourgognense]